MFDGFPYFHYPTPWKTEDSSVYLNQKEGGSIKQECLKERVIWELKEDIKFYKSHTLEQQMVKLSGLDTKQMIEHFIKIDDRKTFHRLSHNCATVTAGLVKIGLPPRMMPNLSEDVSFVFPNSVHWFAKQTKGRSRRNYTSYSVTPAKAGV